MLVGVQLHYTPLFFYIPIVRRISSDLDERIALRLHTALAKISEDIEMETCCIWSRIVIYLSPATVTFYVTCTKTTRKEHYKENHPDVYIPQARLISSCAICYLHNSSLYVPQY